MMILGVFAHASVYIST